MEAKKCCGNCVHSFKAPLQVGAQGQCRRYPPQGFPVPSQGGVAIVQVWAPVNLETDLCGEYKPELPSVAIA